MFILSVCSLLCMLPYLFFLALNKSIVYDTFVQESSVSLRQTDLTKNKWKMKGYYYSSNLPQAISLDLSWSKANIERDQMDQWISHTHTHTQTSTYHSKDAVELGIVSPPPPLNVTQRVEKWSGYHMKWWWKHKFWIVLKWPQPKSVPILKSTVASEVKLFKWKKTGFE